MSAADLHGWLVVGGGRAHALLDLAGHGEEGLLDVAGVLSGGFEEWDTEVIGQVLGRMLAVVNYDSISQARDHRFRLGIS